jgi:hypothetical protein
MARMYEWYEKVGTGIDISALHQEYPEVNWRYLGRLGQIKTKVRSRSDTTSKTSFLPSSLSKFLLF